MIYELRKTLSKNKKYRYIYELVINHEVVYTRKTDKEYIGALVKKTGITHELTAYKCYNFFGKERNKEARIVGELLTVALTFDALKTLK